MEIETVRSLGLTVLGVVGLLIVLLVGLSVATYYRSCPWLVYAPGQGVRCIKLKKPCPRLLFLYFTRCEEYHKALEEALKK